MLFACTDLRCRDIKESNEVFAQINIIVLGDFAQLPPVNGYSIFVKPSKNCKNELGQHG